MLRSSESTWRALRREDEEESTAHLRGGRPKGQQEGSYRRRAHVEGTWCSTQEGGRNENITVACNGGWQESLHMGGGQAARNLHYGLGGHGARERWLLYSVGGG